MNILVKILVIIIILLIGITLFFFIRFQILKIKENKQGWRTRPRGRDSIYYGEKINGEWKNIEISGEMLVGKMNKALYFKTNKEWIKYPEWASNREEIIRRIKKDYTPDQTEYEND